MTQAGMSLTDKLKAMKAARPVSPIHPPEHQAAAYVQPVTQNVPAPVFSPPVPPPLSPPMAPYDPALYAAPVPIASAPMVPSFAVSAPAAPAYAPAPVPQAAPPFVPASPVALVAPQAVPGPQAPLHVVPALEAAPKPRGRPKKAVAPAEAPQVGLAEAGFVLYIGCAPIGVAVTKALDYVNAAHDQLKESTGVSYRQMQYGVGPSELCKALEGVLEYCAATDALNGDILLGDTQIEEDTASVWISKASKVVRAFR